MNKKRLLFVSPGPVFSIKTDKMEALSEYFIGDVITSSSVKEIRETRDVHGFGFHCMTFNTRSAIISSLWFVLFAVLFCVKCRFLGLKHDLVTTYDPLRSGFIGIVCSWILKTRFAPEVNGVYTSPAEYLDNAKHLSTRLKKYCYPKIEGFVLSRADGIKVQFPTQLAPFEGVIKTDIVRCFNNYVAIDQFLTCDEKKERKEILFVGFPFYRKGVDILIAAFKLIAPAHLDWNLKILGWYPNPTTLMKAIGDHLQIQYCPPVFPVEMPKHICSCSIFVMPSRSEAKARTLIESMAAGKARIGSNVDGTPTIIDDGIDGLLFENENARDLAEKMRMLINNPELRIKLGKAGRVRALKEFSKEKYYSDLRKFYEEIIAKR